MKRIAAILFLLLFSLSFVTDKAELMYCDGELMDVSFLGKTSCKCKAKKAEVKRKSPKKCCKKKSKKKVPKGKKQLKKKSCCSLKYLQLSLMTEQSSDKKTGQNIKDQDEVVTTDLVAHSIHYGSFYKSGAALNYDPPPLVFRRNVLYRQFLI
ncbi:MAG: hypothetical protein MI810_04725 [Flavobacteriales bacterium]|nr:hypothetical protein [Flavobacteriales bacterium]